MKQVNMKKSDTVFLFSKKLLATLSIMILFITARTQNTKYGTNALFSNTTGVNNSAFGTNSLYTNTAGNLNTAIGTNSLYTNASGRNTCFKLGLSTLHKSILFQNICCALLKNDA